MIQVPHFLVQKLSYAASRFPYHLLVRNICFDFQGPQVVCLLGKNGAGKSTLLKVCAGILNPDSGQVFLNQTPMSWMSSQRRSEEIGWLAQNLVRCENMRVHEFMELNFCHPDVSSVLNLFGLNSFLKTEISSLSGGEWKRLQLARLWQRKHPILMLDEPDAELDPYHKQRLVSLCKDYTQKQSAIVFVSTHDIFFAREIATQICVLNGGLLVWNSPAREFWASNVLDHVYGSDFFKG